MLGSLQFNEFPVIEEHLGRQIQRAEDTCKNSLAVRFHGESYREEHGSGKENEKCGAAQDLLVQSGDKNVCRVC